MFAQRPAPQSMKKNSTFSTSDCLSPSLPPSAEMTTELVPADTFPPKFVTKRELELNSSTPCVLTIGEQGHIIFSGPTRLC